MSTMSVVVTHVTMVEFHVFQVIPYCFLDTLTYMLGAYWYLMCGVIGETATEVAEDFQVFSSSFTSKQNISFTILFPQALRHIGPAALVADYRGLWLRLSRMTRDTGLATCYTFTFINLYLFLIITLSIYGLMSKINDGFGTKDIGLALTACCSVCLLFFICDEAHYASSNVQTNFQKKLLMVNLSWMNIAGQTEVHQFLRATEMNPSNISLGGFFYVNRNLFKSLLATMVTYLVVLLQFQISIPTELGVPVDENTTMSSNIN
ncbi:gustatory and odorant receptor 24-like [Ctenocephalides felis]|uniref:gustatory and odorant receptor 24-like n=1 Tax=Ctenocephalides felis TaxID=7515 RepID=UPI000E6E4445|nr:gustatory and odorant receptor 24-like [Ctenocephalides felis]